MKGIMTLHFWAACPRHMRGVPLVFFCSPFKMAACHDGRSGAASRLRGKRLHGAGIGSEDKTHLSGTLTIATWNGCGWNGEAQSAAVEIKADILALTETRDRGEQWRDLFHQCRHTTT